MMNLEFVPCKMWHPTELAIKEEEDELFSFPHIAVAWTKYRSPQSVPNQCH